VRERANIRDDEATPMPNLPDPRCFAAAETNPLQQLAARIVAEPDAMQRERFRVELKEDLLQTLRAGRDDLVSDAVTEVSSPEAGSCLWDAVDQAVNTPDPGAGGLAASLFAIPVVFVSAATQSREIPGMLRDVRRLVRVLKDNGALGVHQNFGLNQALCADTSVEAFSPSRLYGLLRRVEAERVDIWPDLIPAPIEIEDSEERVDLRFVTGIVVAGVNAPSLASTAADVGAWGMPFAKELIAQLSQRGVTLLPIPRPPHGLLRSLHLGHHAREEVALQAFVSRVVRELRSRVGEPEVTLTAVRPDTIAVQIASAMGAEPAVVHRWHLHPLDRLPEVVAGILDLLRDCRVERITLVEEIAPQAGRSSPPQSQ
jgi:hypothetical protein